MCSAVSECKRNPLSPEFLHPEAEFDQGLAAVFGELLAVMVLGRGVAEQLLERVPRRPSIPAVAMPRLRNSTILRALHASESVRATMVQLP